MSQIDFYNADKAEKTAIFNAVAAEMGMTPFAVEKDWWVSRTLEIIFQMDIAGHLVFKGGTSLSKAWKLIHRLSEDIDLAIDRSFFKGFEGDLNKSKITELRKESGKYTTGTFFTNLQKAFIQHGFTNLTIIPVETKESDLDPRVIEIHYPNVIHQPSEYVLPRVQVEISCRSLREPFTTKTFGSLVDEMYAGREFAAPLFSVPTVNPERTFLEKLFLLHEEFHRHQDRMRVNRLSRHMYDIYHLAKAGITDEAIHNKTMYETIVSHRYSFSRVGGVNYNLLNPKTLYPLPAPEKMTEWKADYTKMMEDMIYEENKPSFDDLLHTMHTVISQLRAVNWTFELIFPEPKQTNLP